MDNTIFLFILIHRYVLRNLMITHKNYRDNQVTRSNAIIINRTDKISDPVIFEDHTTSRTVISSNELVVSEISIWIVTTIQACLATAVGLYIVLTFVCESGNADIIYGYRCKIVETYLWILWAYFISDTFALLRIYRLKTSNLQNKSFSSFLKQGNYL